MGCLLSDVRIAVLLALCPNNAVDDGISIKYIRIGDVYIPTVSETRADAFDVIARRTKDTTVYIYRVACEHDSTLDIQCIRAMDECNVVFSRLQVRGLYPCEYYTCDEVLMEPMPVQSTVESPWNILVNDKSIVFCGHGNVKSCSDSTYSNAYRIALSQS